MPQIIIGQCKGFFRVLFLYAARPLRIIVAQQNICSLEGFSLYCSIYVLIE
jgi:hypothetical protein